MGQATQAREGVPFIRRLVERGGDRITVIAGSGTKGDNAGQNAAATGAREVHASASIPTRQTPRERVVMLEIARRVTSAERVHVIKKGLR